MAQDAIAYDKAELRRIKGAFKAMDEQAIEEAKTQSGAIADFFRGKVISKSYTREKSGAVARRIAEGSKVSKSSKLGELSFGYASQRFSGGGTTQILWGGMEFGSRKENNFRRGILKAGSSTQPFVRISQSLSNAGKSHSGKS